MHKNIFCPRQILSGLPLCTNITLCSSIWNMMVSSIREAGETMLSVCSAWVNQLMKSCRELWKSVASVKASSSFPCGHETPSSSVFSGEKNVFFFSLHYMTVLFLHFNWKKKTEIYYNLYHMMKTNHPVATTQDKEGKKNNYTSLVPNMTSI